MVVSRFAFHVFTLHVPRLHPSRFTLLVSALRRLGTEANEVPRSFGRVGQLARSGKLSGDEALNKFGADGRGAGRAERGAAGFGPAER